MRLCLIIVVAGIVALGGCTKPRPARSGSSPVPPAPPPREGWKPVFNGHDLSGWTPKFAGHDLGVNHLETFRVEDDAIVVSYDRYDQFDGAFGHLFLDEPYGHYRMRLEYRFTGDLCPGAPGWAFRNSGVMIHGQAPESMSRDQSFPVSIEVQLLGGDGTRERATGNVCTPGTHIVLDGVLDRRHCIDSTSPTFHGDGWVSLEMEVRGGEVIRHLIDGEVVMQYGEPQLDPRDGNAHVLIEERAGNIQLDAGSISLQAEGHACAFRRIEIWRLD
ncbi:MAG: DUF1080 domain-containing protein [Planctomycetes bacterium]|nr:DUF1080 domain-containing protein [Planctomycetota bacterium]